MHIQEKELLLFLSTSKFKSQRKLASDLNCSLGKINESLNNLVANGYLCDNFTLTEKADSLLASSKPKNAIILAAGYGMRMVPINTEYPKGLLEVNGEKLIERLIYQLHAVGIDEIHIVIGFMKESYEYLIDEYGVDLIVNPDYSTKNNLHSLNLAADFINNSYIMPCDIWCRENPFNKNELYSWYMVTDEKKKKSNIRVNRKKQFSFAEDICGNRIIGISYITSEDSDEIKNRIKLRASNSINDNDYWESALFSNPIYPIYSRVVLSDAAFEIDTFEQLRELDKSSKMLKADAINAAKTALGVKTEDIINIKVLKKGMTNRSFTFDCLGKKYVMRLPGEGTSKLINRENEAAVYRAVTGKNLCSEPVYLNPDNGFKITEFLYDVRCCDPNNIEDLKKCIKLLKEFHSLELTVPHEFDIFNQIEFYENLKNCKSVFSDYEKTKADVFSLKKYIDQHCEKKVLTHIDAVPDNFLFYSIDGEERLQLTDWEYAGMQDPHVDIAMFCIYSLYDKEHIDKFIDLYFDNNCPIETRTKIYCYISACGLLWSNWCEYKLQLGIEFGEYSLKQYRYAKKYYKLAKENMDTTH